MLVLHSGKVIFEKILYVLVYRQEKQMLMNHYRIYFHLNSAFFSFDINSSS